MNWRRELLLIGGAVGLFLVFYFLPGGPRFLRAVDQGVLLLNFYAREHVLFCLVPAFFIAGAIEVFVSDQAVLRYLGPAAPKPVAYGVASVAGAILAVCSCTILPIFAGIYTMGAGLGPAAPCGRWSSSWPPWWPSWSSPRGARVSASGSGCTR
ncbi:permease [Dissulfurirhabdus thermomarina]|uniref:permease n=1 Tax=Dissulfurirhabdus thermomarina TaxID=1765737 RepID=UPI0035A6021F